MERTDEFGVCHNSKKVESLTAEELARLIVNRWWIMDRMHGVATGTVELLLTDVHKKPELQKMFATVMVEYAAWCAQQAQDISSGSEISID